MKRLLNATSWLGGRILVLGVLCALLVPAQTFAQGVTTGSLSGLVKDAQEKPVAGATVLALHVPSGTTYEATTRADGRYAILNMRVGGPYSVTIAPAAGASGFEAQTQDDITINLGVSTDLDFIVRSIAVEVTVTAPTSDAVFSSERTGAATQISRQALATLPNISGRLESVTRLTPQSGGNMQFAGQDNRLNNITVDGSYFNNSFGLAGTPGERTGVAPISLEAVEQVQINVAPFDVRQGNFVGAGVNTVTRSGTNQLRGTFLHSWRDESLVGTKAAGNEFNPGTFSYRNTGGSLSGPIVKNKLFVFGNYEDEKYNQPGTTFTANTGGQTVAGNITRVLASDLNALSARLQSQFGYETGGYQDYEHLTPAKRFLVRGDYNINQSNKFSFRYNYLDSITDVLLSNSSSLGFGNRRTLSTGLNFQNSNYQIMEDIRSGIGELNTILGDTMANNLIVGYTTQDESRASRGTFFPFVDILDSNTVYTSFGFEPFTPNNELRYNTFQVQNNLSWFRGAHTLGFGVSVERYESENVFFPGSQSIYTYNSLADFYTDINDLQANPNRTMSPVTLRRFQVRWANIPGMEKPVQPLEVLYTGVYAQDNWRVRNNLTLNLGVRFDVPSFGETAFPNANADALTFRDETGNSVQYSSGKLPDARLHWSPRAGFNWDVFGTRQTQLRGGTGVFTGRPAYVWISNQIGNTGVLTGFEELNNTRTRPFSPDPNRYKPTNVTGAPASSYELALTDPEFMFPQLWRNSIAVDQRLPGGITGTAEFMYNRDVNGVYYINANLANPNSVFVGPDPRPRWVGSNANRIHSNVQNAIVLKNQNEGRSWDMSFSAEKQARSFWMKAAYRYGEAKNTVDPGSIAFGSWNNNQHTGDPNNPGLAYAAASPGHRFFIVGSYTAEYFSFGKTTVSLFYDRFTNGNTSYIVSGDLNGDGGTSNDLLYIPQNASELNFQQFTSGGRTYTVAEQQAAFESFIESDSYLRERRGQYAQRGAVFLPMVGRVDASLQQEIFSNLGGRRHGLQFRVDILNFGNLLNSDWGVGERIRTTSPLLAQAQTATSGVAPLYRMRTITTGGDLYTTARETSAGTSDVWRVQFGFRYSFQ